MTPEARQLDQEIRTRLKGAYELRVLPFGCTQDEKKYVAERSKVWAALREDRPLDNPDIARAPDPETIKTLRTAEDQLSTELKSLLGPDKQRAKELSTLWLKEGLQDPVEVVRLGHLWKISRRLAELRMVRAGVEGNYQKMQRYDKLLYPPLPKDFILLSLKATRSSAEAHLESDDPTIRATARELLRDLPVPPPVELSVSEPTPEQLRTAQIKTQSDMADLLAYVLTVTGRTVRTTAQQEAASRPRVGPPAKGRGAATRPRHGINLRVVESADRRTAMVGGYEFRGNLSSDDVADVFTKALQINNAEDWIVVQRSGSSQVIAPSSQIQVRRGESVSVRDMPAFVVHETTHLKRALAGTRTGFSILIEGTPGYLKAEEGITGFVEEAYIGKVRDYLWPVGVLSMGLAEGVDGTPRAPKDVLPLTYKISRFNRLKNLKKEYGHVGPLPESVVQQETTEALKNTWDIGEKTWRYTNFKDAGLINHRQGIYTGHIAVWNNLSRLQEYAVGKLDPDNPKDMWIARQLVVRPTDLAAAERT